MARHVYARKAIRARYRRADFAAGGAEAEMLRAALLRLTTIRRLVIEARFCGITRSVIGGAVFEHFGARLSVRETADYLGCRLRLVTDQTDRAMGDLVDMLPREEESDRLTAIRESRRMLAAGGRAARNR